MNIAIIPARGGSKRIPRKNIKEFCGKPIIAYAIHAAKKSGIFSRIVVSTDDEEIALVAKTWGAEVPFFRPIELANDYAETAHVIAHAVQSCKLKGWRFDNVCCIYPCVPFIQIQDLLNALERMKITNAEFCFPVAEYPSAMWRALKLIDGWKTQPIFPEYELKRTQDLDVAYFDAGQFYWGKAEAWQAKPLIHSNGVGYNIPNWRTIDIDTLDDWQRAELIFRAIGSKATFD